MADISRRNFFKTAAATAASGTLIGPSPLEAAQTPVSFDLLRKGIGKLQLNDRSEFVKTLRLVLNVSNITSDTFDAEMQGAVKEFQKQIGETQNGIISGNTAKELCRRLSVEIMYNEVGPDGKTATKILPNELFIRDLLNGTNEACANALQRFTNNFHNEPCKNPSDRLSNDFHYSYEAFILENILYPKDYKRIVEKAIQARPDVKFLKDIQEALNFNIEKPLLMQNSTLVKLIDRYRNPTSNESVLILTTQRDYKGSFYYVNGLNNLVSSLLDLGINVRFVTVKDEDEFENKPVTALLKNKYGHPITASLVVIAAHSDSERLVTGTKGVKYGKTIIWKSEKHLQGLRKVISPKGILYFDGCQVGKGADNLISATHDILEDLGVTCMGPKNRGFTMYGPDPTFISGRIAGEYGPQTISFPSNVPGSRNIFFSHFKPMRYDDTRFMGQAIIIRPGRTP